MKFHIVETLVGHAFDVRAPSLEAAFAAVRAETGSVVMLLDCPLPAPAGAQVVDVMPEAVPVSGVPDSVYWAEVAGDRRSRGLGLRRGG